MGKDSSVKIDDTLKREAHIIAISMGQSLKDFVEQAVRVAIADIRSNFGRDKL